MKITTTPTDDEMQNLVAEIGSMVLVAQEATPFRGVTEEWLEFKMVYKVVPGVGLRIDRLALGFSTPTEYAEGLPIRAVTH